MYLLTYLLTCSLIQCSYIVFKKILYDSVESPVLWLGCTGALEQSWPSAFAVKLLLSYVTYLWSNKTVGLPGLLLLCRRELSSTTLHFTLLHLYQPWLHFHSQKLDVYNNEKLHHCDHWRLSSLHWRRNCFADRTTTHTSGNSSIDTSLVRDIYCGPEVLFETCVTMKFVDDDDDDNMIINVMLCASEKDYTDAMSDDETLSGLGSVSEELEGVSSSTIS